MASTFSPSLKIELIGDGDQSGIWGQTTNTNLGTLIEQAITGVVTITMTDTNYTLTSFNGVSDEARNQVIVATGTNSAQRNIIAPLVEKTYTIKNSTTGGFAVQIIGSSGTGVVIPNGVTASVYCDGTNFFPTQVNSIGNQTINGNLVVTGTTNLTGTLTASTGGFSGALTAPTAAPGTNTTQVATTAFVQNLAGTLGTMSQQNANAVAITGGTITGITDLAIADGGTGASTAPNARTNLGLGSIATQNSSTVSITGGTITGITDLAIVDGGTGASDATTARSNLGLGSIATQAASNVAITGGTIGSAVTGSTQVPGTNNTTLATTAFVRSIIPTGVILLWSGSVASIPSGWVLCDGSNSTPDLRNRFVVGAGSTYAVGDTGGNANATLVSHTHTATSAVTDPGHFHSFTTGDPGSSGEPLKNGNSSSGFNTAIASTGITVATTNSTEGSSATNANLPPYYALAYIMKT